MQIDYTAKRSVKSGHTATTAYTINVDLNVEDRTSNIDGKQSKSLNGSTVTLIHRTNIFYDLETVITSTTTTPDIDDMREFLDSVKGGETFQLDVAGSSVDYILDSITSPYTETRFSNNLFRYAFKVRQL